MRLRSEADVARSLAGHTITLDQLYAACEAAGVTTRDRGSDIIHGRTDTRWRRRARNALQAMRRSGRAERVGESTWLIAGTRSSPRGALLVIANDPSEITLALADAAELLDTSDDPLDLIVTDPPWALDIQQTDDLGGDQSERTYARDASKVVRGYIDVAAEHYREFTEQWITAAARALRPGGHLAVITGPQAAAHIHLVGASVGLHYLNSIVVTRPFAVRCTRRFAFAHLTITVLCAGPLSSSRRYFVPPADLPRARSGAAYPLDAWTDIPKHERPGQLRYPAGGLHPRIIRRLVHAFTPGPNSGHPPLTASVCDPFLGGGTTAIVCWEERRRFLGGDLNPQALRYTIARLTEEHIRPAQAQPRLFEPAN
jgi:DNA modification methylase